MEILIEEISARKKVLIGRLDDSISMQSKRRAWERVAEAVSAVANSIRDVDGVKKKWADLKSAVKKKKGAEREIKGAKNDRWWITIYYSGCIWREGSVSHRRYSSDRRLNPV